MCHFDPRRREKWQLTFMVHGSARMDCLRRWRALVQSRVTGVYPRSHRFTVVVTLWYICMASLSRPQKGSVCRQLKCPASSMLHIALSIPNLQFLKKEKLSFVLLYPIPPKPFLLFLCLLTLAVLICVWECMYNECEGMHTCVHMDLRRGYWGRSYECLWDNPPNFFSGCWDPDSAPHDSAARALNHRVISSAPNRLLLLFFFF